MTAGRRGGPRALVALRALVATVAVAALLGCSPTEVKVSHAELGSEGHTLLNFAYAEDRRETYTTEDEKVTFAVRLGYNIVGYYTAFRVHWVAPTGATYLDAPARTAWGTNQALIAELPVKGTPAVRLPGLWSVRLYAKGELLAEREFELLDARYLAQESVPAPGAAALAEAAPEAAAGSESGSLAVASRAPAETARTPGEAAPVDEAPAADQAPVADEAPAADEAPVPGEAPTAGADEALERSSTSYAGVGTLELPDLAPELQPQPAPDAVASTATGQEPSAAGQEPSAGQEPQTGGVVADATGEPSGRILWVDIRRQLESDAGIAEIDELTDEQ